MSITVGAAPSLSTMNVAHDQGTHLSGGQIGLDANNPQAVEGFTWLTTNRQVLVFQTIQEAHSASPPRLEATFENVLTAYITLSRVVNAASLGRLTEADLAKLESDIISAGGVIAPGLRSQGENSLASFRAATFGLVNRHYSSAVAASIRAALNAHLASLKLADLGEVFQAIAAFLEPLIPTPDPSASLELFDQFDGRRQIFVFETIRDAIIANPPRREATFEAVVGAFQAEIMLLESAQAGSFSTDLLSRLEACIAAAGGKLAPDIYAVGDHSVSAFHQSTLQFLEGALATEVFPAVLSCLNVRLRGFQAKDLHALFEAVENFLGPLLPSCWDTPTMKDFRSLDPRRQILVFRTIELMLNNELQAVDDSMFIAAVNALVAERSILEAAGQGMLSAELLDNFCACIDTCGGMLASGIRSQGAGSIGEFVDVSFNSLQASLPVAVYQAIVSALNAKLKISGCSDIDGLMAEVYHFTRPLRESHPIPLSTVAPSPATPLTPSSRSRDGSAGQASLTGAAPSSSKSVADPISGKPIVVAAAPLSDAPSAVVQPHARAPEELRLELHYNPPVILYNAELTAISGRAASIVHVDQVDSSVATTPETTSIAAALSEPTTMEVASMEVASMDAASMQAPSMDVSQEPSFTAGGPSLNDPPAGQDVGGDAAVADPGPGSDLAQGTIQSDPQSPGLTGSLTSTPSAQAVGAPGDLITMEPPGTRDGQLAGPRPTVDALTGQFDNNFDNRQVPRAVTNQSHWSHWNVWSLRPWQRSSADVNDRQSRSSWSDR